VRIKQPVSLPLSLGDKASPNIIASGDAPLTYQWQLAGVPVPGATILTVMVQFLKKATGTSTGWE